MKDKQINLKVGSQTAMINGQAVALDAPVEINNGSTMVPLRFVGEAFDQKVDFNNATKTITLTDKAGVQAQTPPVQAQTPAPEQKSPKQVAIEKKWLDTFTIISQSLTPLYR